MHKSRYYNKWMSAEIPFVVYLPSSATFPGFVATYCLLRTSAAEAKKMFRHLCAEAVKWRRMFSLLFSSGAKGGFGLFRGSYEINFNLLD
jgi:hypothetical protein